MSSKVEGGLYFESTVKFKGDNYIHSSNYKDFIASLLSCRLKPTLGWWRASSVMCASMKSINAVDFV